MSKLNTSIFLSDHVNRKGLSKLYLQVIINRKTRRYPLEIFVEPENWDSANSKVIKRADKVVLNRIVTNELAKINDHYLKMREPENVCFEKLDELYLKIDNTKISDIVAFHCKTISTASYKFYNTAESELKKLFGDISINKIDYNKIVLYHDSIKDLAHNTIKPFR